MADTAKDAQTFVCQTRNLSVPLWLVEVRVTYDEPMQWTTDALWCGSLRLLVQTHAPNASWEPGKWQIGFDAWVGGERRNDYGDKKWRMLNL